MNCICYVRGSSPEKRSAVTAFCDKHGITPMLVLCDKEDEYAAFRYLQDLIKLRRCDTVAVDSALSLGGDRYMRLENELFMKRNGVRLLYAERPVFDARHDIAAAIKRYYGYLPEENVAYGLEMPMPKNPEVFKRKPPFGYYVREGRVVVKRSAADIVSYIFERYANGDAVSSIRNAVNEKLPQYRQFSTMTVNTVLCNERYLGVMSEKGFHLPPIITYDKWLMARERYEREHAVSHTGGAYLENVKCAEPIVYLRDGRACGAIFPNAVTVDADLLEREAESITAAAASAENAEAFRQYAERELKEAEEAYSDAAEEHRRLLRGFKRDISLVCEGGRSQKLQERLEKRTDKKNFSAMRLRRIASERDVFDAACGKCVSFFERASRISCLSTGEKRFICAAFIHSVRIENGRVYAYVRTPSDGSIKRIRLDRNIIRKT